MNDMEHKQATADTAKRYINDALKEIEKANAEGRLPIGCYTICKTRLGAAEQYIDMLAHE